MKVTYIERQFLTKYTCIDREKTFYANSYFVPEGTELYYFKINEFNYKTIGKDDIIKIEG